MTRPAADSAIPPANAPDERGVLQLIFTHIAQRAAIITTLLSLAHGTLLYMAHDAAAIWCLGLAPVYLVIYQLIGVRGNYPVYLGGLLAFLAIVSTYAVLLAQRFGAGIGFLWLMVPIVSILMINVRLGSMGKWAVVGPLIAFVIWHDFSIEATNAAHLLPPTILALIRAINLGVALVTVAALTLDNFNIIARAQADLERNATTDQLTGLWNRRRLSEIAEEAIAARKRYHHPVSMLFADIDHFKQINDTHGHEKGDEALRTVAARLVESARDTDSVGRWGGEEFLIVLPQTDIEGAMVIAERLRRGVAVKGVSGAPDEHLSITLGVAEVREDESFAACIARADDALRSGKAAGRNRTVRAE